MTTKSYFNFNRGTRHFHCVPQDKVDDAITKIKGTPGIKTVRKLASGNISVTFKRVRKFTDCFDSADWKVRIVRTHRKKHHNDNDITETADVARTSEIRNPLADVGTTMTAKDEVERERLDLAARVVDFLADEEALKSSREQPMNCNIVRPHRLDIFNTSTKKHGTLSLDFHLVS